MTQVPALDWDKPLRTKSGHKARLVCRDVKNDERTFLVLVDHSEFETATAYDAEGRHATHRGLDLENAPERQVIYHHPDLIKGGMAITLGGSICRDAAIESCPQEARFLLRVEYEGSKPVSVALEAIE